MGLEGNPSFIRMNAADVLLLAKYLNQCVFVAKKLYAAMHEPDGVEGVSAIRKAEPSLKEQILEHESIGLLRDATACYDRAIQLEPDEVIVQPSPYF